MSKYRRLKPYIRNIKKTDNFDSFIDLEYARFHGNKKLWVVVQHGAKGNILATSSNKQELKKRMSLGTKSFKDWQKKFQNICLNLP